MVGSASAGSWVDTWAKVVLHEYANALVTVTVPRSNSPWLRMSRPSVIHVPGQDTIVSGVSRPADRPALAVTILKVEPGGYRPVRPMLPWALAAEFCATVRI